MKEGQIVIVVSVDNYQSQYAEEVPFKAVLLKITNYPCYWVKSETTGNEYELYDHQLLEGLTIEQINRMMDLSKYGS